MNLREMYKMRQKKAKLVIKNALSAKQTFALLKQHFKEDGWDLDYHLYKDMSEVPPYVFDLQLKHLGYTVKLNQYGTLVICCPKR